MVVAGRTLALFLVCVSAVRVSGENVTVTASTTAVQVSWEKTGQWEDVNFFHVDLKMNGNPFCEKDVLCLLSTKCTFNSEAQCGMFSPCSDASVTVSGGNFKAPQEDVVTAPAPVTDIEITGPANNTVTWKNPTSSCLENLAVAVVYGGYYDYALVLDKNENSVTVPLCMDGKGTVEVRTIGGNGESDATTAYISRDLGDDAVEITSCPPQGCTDVAINWKYQPVCPDADHLFLTLGDIWNTTADLNTTGVTTTTVLDLNTQYETCLHAYDADDQLLARHCTKCGSQPEVVDQLRVTNVSDTTAVIDWEPPICPTTPINQMEYYVSHPILVGKERSYVTNDSMFEWTEVQPATPHTFCVTVQHSGVPSADPACVNTFTLPAALEKIKVRVYEESLFITWEADVVTPNLKYRVSWGNEADDLTHSDHTTYKSYTIDGYNKTVGPNEVCVEVQTKFPIGLRSTTTCQSSPFPNFIPDKPDHTDMIIGVSVSAGLAVLLSTVLVVMAVMESPPSKKL